MKPSFGLMRDLGVPCLVNPSDPSEIWIDWDAAYKEHAPAWEREARVRGEVERRKGGIDGALARLATHGGQAAAGGGSDRRRALRARGRRRGGELSAGWTSWPGSCATAARRPAWSSPTPRPDKTSPAVPLRVLTFEVEGRIVVFEHLFGQRHAEHYAVGKTVEVWVDPDDPAAIRPGR